MSSPRVIKEGYLIKRAMISGRNWKKRYFILTDDGVISYGAKQGDPPKNRVQLTSQSTVSVLPDAEVGGDSGFCIKGPGHNPLFLKWKKSEGVIAEEWLGSITKIIKSLGGGSNKNLAQYDSYNPKSTLSRQASGMNNRRNKTLERVKGSLSETGKKAAEKKESNDEMPEGWQMKIGKTKGAPDYFVSSKTWEYYNSAQDCKDGKPSLGKALLALLV